MSLNRRARGAGGAGGQGGQGGAVLSALADAAPPQTCHNSPLWSATGSPRRMPGGAPYAPLSAMGALGASVHAECTVVPPPAQHCRHPAHAHAAAHAHGPAGHTNAFSASMQDIEMELQQHIQQCNCTCDHMGYGNYMDYQTTCLSELPDVAAPRCNGRLPLSHSHIHLGYPDSASSCSSKDSAPEARGRAVRFKPWCVCLLVCAVCLALIFAIAMPLTLRGARSLATHQDRLDLVRRLLKEVPLIDGHNDLPWNMRKYVHNQMGSFNFSKLDSSEPWKTSNWSHTDLTRLRTGMVGAQFWSAYVPCGAQFLDAVQLTLEQIDVIKRLAEMHPDSLRIATTVKAIHDAHQGGQIASLIGVEGGHTLGNSLAVLRMYYGLGARYLTLTHTCDTPWADCSVGEKDLQTTDDSKKPARHKSGLSHFGKLVVKEMNRLGMMVDLSHASVRTMEDALNVTQAPLVFSHSSARTICNSTRNVPDEILQQVAANGGIVMVNFYTYFVTCNHTADLQDVIDHINHIRKVAGTDHVGIGAGYDGINKTPRGLEDVSKYPDLLATLLADPSWTEDDVKKLAGGNLLRVFSAVEEVRDKWRLAAVPPSDELIGMNFLEGKTDCLWMGS